MPRSSSRAHLHLHFRVRLVFMRFLVNAFSLAITVAVVPHVYFSGDYRVLSWLLISAVFGLLNALFKPLIQLALLPLIFISYGFVVVMINAFLLWILSLLFQRFHVDYILWTLLAGLVCGGLEGLFQTLFGVTPPIVEGGVAALGGKPAVRAHGIVESELLAVTAEDAPDLAVDASAPAADEREGVRR